MRAITRGTGFVSMSTAEPTSFPPLATVTNRRGQSRIGLFELGLKDKVSVITDSEVGFSPKIRPTADKTVSVLQLRLVIFSSLVRVFVPAV